MPKKLSYAQLYKGSSRENMVKQMRHAIAEQCGPAWADAYDRATISRGKDIGFIKIRKPSNDDMAGVIWEVWNHSRGQREARKYGLVAHMSFGGLMASMMFCNVPEGNESAVDASRRLENLFESIYWKRRPSDQQ